MDLPSGRLALRPLLPLLLLQLDVPSGRLHYSVLSQHSVTGNIKTYLGMGYRHKGRSPTFHLQPS
jgi:hypothetical protein